MKKSYRQNDKSVQKAILLKRSPVGMALYKRVLLCLVIFLMVGVGACSSVERARNAADVVVTNKKHFNLQALVQAEIERQRVRKLRCHSPFLNPSSVSDAALHPNLGRSWVDELLRDCPEYSAFIAELVLRRAEDAGVEALRGLKGRAE